MDLFPTETARWMFAAWFTFLGAAVGSFLNVVVYRLPAGLNIAWPGSHCPRCKHAIRSYDNVPVLAWLWLRGRCRDCRLPISARYPLVEAVTGGLFALLLVVEVFHHGHNLPARAAHLAGADGYPQSQGLAMCLLHLGLLCTLLAAALMTLDGNRPPRRLFVPVAIVGFLAPMVYPWLRPQPMSPEMGQHAGSGVIESLVGMGVGYCVGSFVGWLGRRVAGVGKAGYRIWSESIVLGIVLGWQSCVVLVLLAMLLEEFTRMAALRWRRLGRMTAAVWLPPLTLLLILNWTAFASLRW